METVEHILSDYITQNPEVKSFWLGQIEEAKSHTQTEWDAVECVVDHMRLVYTADEHLAPINERVDKAAVLKADFTCIVFDLFGKTDAEAQFQEFVSSYLRKQEIARISGFIQNRVFMDPDSFPKIRAKEKKDLIDSVDWAVRTGGTLRNVVFFVLMNQCQQMVVLNYINHKREIFLRDNPDAANVPVSEAGLPPARMLGEYSKPTQPNPTSPEINKTQATSDLHETSTSPTQAAKPNEESKNKSEIGVVTAGCLGSLCVIAGIVLAIFEDRFNSRVALVISGFAAFLILTFVGNIVDHVTNRLSGRNNK